MNTSDSLAEMPAPSACSTENKKSIQVVAPAVKQDVKRNLMDMDVSTDSLGILTLDDMRPTKDSYTNLQSTTSENLLDRMRELANTRALLEKYANRKNALESTINESDLREPTNNTGAGLTPAKYSTVNESDLLRDSEVSSSNTSLNQTSPLQNSKQKLPNFNVSKTDSFSSFINDLKAQIEKNDSASLSEIIGNASKQSLEFDSGMFQPAENMKGVLDEDERAWRMQHAVLPNTTRASISSETHSSLFDEKISMGEFFRQRSDHCSLFNTGSPLKEPIPLVNSTTIDESFVSDVDRNTSTISNTNLSGINQSLDCVLSLSGIQNLISGESTPGSLIEKLIGGPLGSSNISNKTESTQSMNSHKYSGNSQQLKESSRDEILTPTLRNDGYYKSRASLGTPSPLLKSATKYSKYASSVDLRTPAKAASTKIFTAKSLTSISDNKENLMTSTRSEEKNKTITSCRSTSSMESIPDGMTKLASTKNELVWGCVKEGRSLPQDVTIRNKNNRRVKYMIYTSNPNFKLTNIELQGDKGVIVLHPLETRQIFVQCTPNSVGPHTGNLFFAPIVRKEEHVSSRQHITMFAYGGHVNLQIKGQTRDLAGKLWISLGSVDGRRELTADFVIRNSGNINGFVSLTVSSKSLCAFDDISLTPSKVVIKRGSETTVRVRFRPSKNDLHLLNNALGGKSMKASEIAVIRMISGADINRQRINKIMKKYNDGQEPLAQQLAAQYQNATRTDDMRHFNETNKSVKILMQTLETTEISLLVDRDMDTTMLPEVDDSTVFFKTMVCPDESSLMDQLSERSYMKPFNVEPSKVLLTPPSKSMDNLLLSTNYDRPVAYKVSVSPGGPLTVGPSSGTINPGEIRKIKVECDFRVTMARQDFDVIFEIEGDVVQVTVSILKL